MQIILGFTLAALISWLAYRAHALDTSGLRAAVVLGGVVFASGGFIWSAPLLVFFISSSLWSRIGARGNQKPVPAEGSRGRSARQVLANGGPSLLAAAVQMLHPDAVWTWWFHLGALAAVTADTWATEIGPLVPGPTRLITTGKKVPPGTSGGVSAAGTLAAGVGAASLGALASLPGWVEWRPVLVPGILLAGLTGSLVDSLLGASLQQIYICPECQEKTEHHGQHSCGHTLERIRGLPGMNNDTVNLICGLTGGTLSILILLIWIP